MLGVPVSGLYVWRGIGAKQALVWRGDRLERSERYAALITTCAPCRFDRVFAATRREFTKRGTSDCEILVNVGKAKEVAVCR